MDIVQQKIKQDHQMWKQTIEGLSAVNSAIHGYRQLFITAKSNKEKKRLAFRLHRCWVVSDGLIKDLNYLMNTSGIENAIKGLTEEDF